MRRYKIDKQTIYWELSQIMERNGKAEIVLQNRIKTYYGNIAAVKLVPIPENDLILKMWEEDKNVPIWGTPESENFDYSQTNSNLACAYIQKIAKYTYSRYTYCPKNETVKYCIVFLDSRGKSLKDKHECDSVFTKVLGAVKKAIKKTISKKHVTQYTQRRYIKKWFKNSGRDNFIEYLNEQYEIENTCTYL